MFAGDNITYVGNTKEPMKTNTTNRNWKNFEKKNTKLKYRKSLHTLKQKAIRRHNGRRSQLQQEQNKIK